MALQSGNDQRPGPIVVVGAHVQGLFLRVGAVPREGETVLGFDFSEPLDGGKATHQAIAAARLGAPTTLITALGRDERGVRWRRFLEAEGIDMQGTVETDRPTDVGFVMLPPSSVPAIVSALDANASLDGPCVAQRAEVLRAASLVVCQLEAPVQAAIAAFRLARSAGARTILNPAPAAELPDELLQLTDILVPNEHEAAALLGAPCPTNDLAAALSQRYHGMAVLVTAGAAGVYAMDAYGCPFHIPAPVVDVVDTTGAGDEFVGALAVRLRAGDTLRVATAFAVRAASLSTTRAGSIPSLPTATEMACQFA